MGRQGARASFTFARRTFGSFLCFTERDAEAVANDWNRNTAKPRNTRQRGESYVLVGNTDIAAIFLSIHGQDALRGCRR